MSVTDVIDKSRDRFVDRFVTYIFLFRPISNCRNIILQANIAKATDFTYKKFRLGNSVCM